VTENLHEACEHSVMNSWSLLQVNRLHGPGLHANDQACKSEWTTDSNCIGLGCVLGCECSTAGVCVRAACQALSCTLLGRVDTCGQVWTNKTMRW